MGILLEHVGVWLKAIGTGDAQMKAELVCGMDIAIAHIIAIADPSKFATS